MRIFFKGFFLFFLMALAASAGAAEIDGVLDNTGNPHFNHGKGKCFICHTKRPPQLTYDHVETCTNCHIGNIANHPVTRHPIDEVVKIKIPGPLPLTEELRIVCSTCHDPHDDQGFTRMLRVDLHMLCVQCHRGY